MNTLTIFCLAIVGVAGCLILLGGVIRHVSGKNSAPRYEERSYD